MRTIRQLAARFLGWNRPLRGWGSILTAFIIFAAMLPGAWLVNSWYRGELAQEERDAVAEDFAPFVNTIGAEISERLAILGSLESLVTATSGKSEVVADMGVRSALLLARAQDLRGVVVAPGGVVEQGYPRLPDGVKPGDDLLGSIPSPYSAAIERAVRDRGTALATMYDSETGKRDVMAWRASYTEREFWGLVSMRLDLDHMFAHLDGGPSPSIEIAVRDGNGAVLFGDERVFASRPEAQRVVLPDGYWELAAIPAGGWGQTVVSRERVAQAFGLTVALLLGWVIYLVLSRQALLEGIVRERTREVNRVNLELAADVERRKRLEEEHRLLLEQLGQQVALRTHHLSALYDVTAVASSSLDLTTVLESSLDRVLAVMGCDVASAHLYPQSNFAQGRIAFVRTSSGQDAAAGCPMLATSEPDCWVYHHHQPILVQDIAADPRTRYAYRALGPRAHAGTVIRGPQGPVGILCVFRACSQPFAEEEASLLGAIADHLGVAVENARLFADAQGKATLEERQRLARELHDSVTQLLYSSVLIAEAARRTSTDAVDGKMHDLLARLGTTVQQALRETRLLVYELRPLSLEQDGLVGALQRRLDAVERRAGMQAELSIRGLDNLAPEVQESLYRIAQEALNNTLKHASAKTVAVEIDGSEDAVRLRVVDDGHGFDPETTSGGGGMGLPNMRERAERLGGKITIQTGIGRGTMIEVGVPRANVFGTGDIHSRVEAATL